tara:strand:- start:2795 stop:3643 length:849 start_codon:yes stop_codon:yes gene_type:complete
MGDDRFVVLTEYFRSDHLGRRKEIIKSIEVNARIPQTKRVVLFIDPEIEFPKELQRVLSKEHFNKIEVHELTPGGRSTYSDLLSYANEHLIGENCVLCNNDISFDETLDLLKDTEGFDLEGHFVCLTRWDVLYDNSLRFKQPARIRKNSQDAWVFKPLLPTKMIERGGFYMGRPGCDGMISYLATISGLKVFNPSETVRAKHLHLSRRRTYSRQHRMGGDGIYMCTFPTDKIKFDPDKLMYKFGSPTTTKLYGQDATDQAMADEEEMEQHWDYALDKCRRLT